MSGPVTAIYRPRRIRFLEVWRPAGWILKVYLITHEGRSLVDGRMDAVFDRAQARLDEIDAMDPAHHGLGFVMLHLGENGDYLLVDTWTDNDILRHANYGAKPGGAFRDDWPGTGACVWELAVVLHERAAWLRHMLRPDGRPDPGSWVADQLNAIV
ncbi:MAG: hypothetical protein GVY28_13170 [Alphaproteobacteria bacterium]|jgi:hypothetical protein|nr:hypothetical protein [Alphaproteobacteria bacterium]